MAGQPQENSWTQQGHGYSQGAPGYGPGYEQQGQPVPYSQQGQVYEQPGTYEEQPGTYQPSAGYEQQAYQQPQSYEQQPAYGEQPTVYDQHDTVYDQAGGQQAYAHQPPQAYPGQPQPGQAPGQQPGWEQWQLPQQQARPQKQKQKQKLKLKPKQKSPKPAGAEPGFVGSLFDFSFASFVTPKIIKALYALVAVWTILWAIVLLFIGNHLGHVPGLLFVLIIVDPILILVSLGTLRVVLEFFMVTFRMQEDLKALRQRSADTASATRMDADSAGADMPGRDGV